ncbi:MAG: GGDEF domain-containing protein [Pirellulales bacterium]|nr:GGDEF domain-containing protein [Pirellulales bacterium]
MFCSTSTDIFTAKIVYFLAASDSFIGALPEELKLTVLAAAIVCAYVLGRRANSRTVEIVDQSRRDLRRAQAVARDLEKVSMLIKKQLSKHQVRVNKFKQRVTELSMSEHENAWRELCREAEDMLRPTMQLASQISSAYDEIRQQSGHLMTFTDVRTDPLTGLANRRALDETLNSQFAMKQRYDSSFSIAMFDLDNFKQINDEHGHLHGDQILKEFTRILDDCARETDTVARYGGEEFIVVMPQTCLNGAAIFAERIRARIEEKMTVTISGGVTSIVEGDTPETILTRADETLYEAKSAGRNSIFKNDGKQSSYVKPESYCDESKPVAI